jgi:kynurenine formamidase
VVLIVTGWSRHWGTDRYLAHPWISAGLAEELLACGVLTVGVDTLSVDLTPAAGEPVSGLPAHLALARAGCVIAENLTGLEALLADQAAGATIEVSLLPLRLAHGDGAPVRAVARVTPAS